MRKILFVLLMIATTLGIVVHTTVSAEAAQNQCEITGEPSVVAGDWNSVALWEKGSISATGAEYKAANFARTKDYLPENITLVYAENDYVFRVAVYDLAGTFLGFWDNNEISATSKTLYYLNPQGLENCRIRLICQRLGASTIDVAECANIHFLDSGKKEEFAPRPTLTFIDDDGSMDALNNWESICDETGIKITSALVTNAMGDENDPDRTKASWSDVARLQEKGFEFVSHTHNHINVLKTEDKVCEADFAASVALLKEHGCEYRYLVYPYNATSSQKIALVKKYFEAAVGLGGNDSNPGSDNTMPVYTHWLRRYSINEAETTTKVAYNGTTVDAHAFKSLDTLKGYIDDAVANNSWVIIMTHLRNNGEFYHDAESRQMILDLCQYAQEKGVAIQNFGEAYSRFKNIAETGTQSIYGNPHYVVDGNGVVHYRGQDEAGHIVEIIPGKSATCVESGWTEGKYCPACDEMLVPQEEIPVTEAHIFDNDNDAVCNGCYYVREMVDTYKFENYGVTFVDSDTTHTNQRVVVYNIGKETVIDPSDETLLKSIDSKAKTYWDAKNINKIVLTDAGNYIFLLKYNVASGAVVKAPLRVSVSTAPKLFVDNNRITVVDSFTGNINHRLVIYYLGDETVEDISNETALKTIDPKPATYWGIDKINKHILQKAGNYALLLHYNEGKSEKKTVAQLAQATAMSVPIIEGLSADYRLVVTDEDVSHKNHRATAYYVGEKTGEETYDEAQLRTIDPSAKTYWGLSKINKMQLRKKGDYAVVLHYNLSNGAKRTVTATITVDLETPVLTVQDSKLNVRDIKNQYVNHRATVYYLADGEIEDIYDEAALQNMDPAAKTYWGLDKINKVTMTRSGTYVVMFHYNLPNSAKMTIALQIDI